MVTVVSGVHPAGLIEYGHRFLSGWSHWPRSHKLAFYTELPNEMPVGAINRSVWECEGAVAFYERHRNRPESNGRRTSSYSFAFDAVKFFKQLFIPEHAAAFLPDGEALCWLDADVVTHTKVPEHLIEAALDGNDLCYLGRDATHSEIGFWAVRLNAASRGFLKSLADMYRTDTFLQLKQWHSAYVFDACRADAEEASALRARNLTRGHRGHVWFRTELGKYTDHTKGPRKRNGYSPENPVAWWERACSISA